jgi:hypothetical protein
MSGTFRFLLQERKKSLVKVVEEEIVGYESAPKEAFAQSPWQEIGRLVHMRSYD